MKKLGRIPLPRKAGHPHGTKKGKKGYDRKRKEEKESWTQKSYTPTL